MSSSKAQALAARLQQQLNVSEYGLGLVLSYGVNFYPTLAVSKGVETEWIHIAGLGNAGRVDGIGQPQRDYSPHMLQVLRQSRTGVSQVVNITAIAGTALDGEYFVLADESGTVGFWFDETGTTPMPVTGAARNVKITTVASTDTAAQVAGKLVTAIGADTKFTSALVSGANLTATNKYVGIITAVPAAGTSGFTVTKATSGVNVPTQLEMREKVLAEAVRLGAEVQIWEIATAPTSFDLTNATMIVDIFPDPMNKLTNQQ